MSERKSLLTSISSALGEEFFSRVATTFKITGWEAKIRSWSEERGEMTQEKQVNKKYFRIECEGLFTRIKTTKYRWQSNDHRGTGRCRQRCFYLLGFWILTVESGSGWGL